MKGQKTHRKITTLRRQLAHRRMPLFWAVAAIALIGPWSTKGCSFPQPVIQEGCTVSSVHDGDTIRAECNGEKLKVRLYCIDAPEMGQKPWGRESRDTLRGLLPRGSVVQLKIYDTDRYGRKVAEIIRAGENVNRMMVQSGQAVVYGKYCPARNRHYYESEAQASRERSGVWSRSGDQQTPWEWRHARRNPG